jgi:hypothetical protein
MKLEGSIFNRVYKMLPKKQQLTIGNSLVGKPHASSSIYLINIHNRLLHLYLNLAN